MEIEQSIIWAFQLQWVGCIEEGGAMKDADRIRAYIRDRFVEAEAKGLSVVCVKAGDVHKQLGLVNQVPNVVRVMKQYLDEARGDLIAKEPPEHQGPDVIYVYRLPKP